ncbi:MAG: PGPGW domain-containing protein [Acidobacteria bacterium]|nr:PGPGW domain-containing protein [Acidobacteriota bacterium]
MLIKTLQQAKRVIKIVVGFTILLAGVVMLVTPGPGWVAIFGGLAILAAEFVWARRLLDHLKHHGGKLRDAVFNSKNSKNPPDSPAESPK